MQDITGAEYIRQNYRPDDWLCVFVKYRERTERHGLIGQHFMTAAELATAERQTWLKAENDSGASVYVTTNALRQGAKNRTEQDVAAIRHIYLDIDENGKEILEKIKADTEAGIVPPSNTVMNTSPGKYQVLWNVKDFSPETAKALQKALAVQYGADIAVFDVARVLRIPGYLNQKPEYETPHLVTAEKISSEISSPADFKISLMENEQTAVRQTAVTPQKTGDGSRSENDWFEVCRRLERGDNPDDVRDWLALSRPDKPRPRYYAELTVRKAVSHCAVQMAESSEQTDFIRKKTNVNIENNNPNGDRTEQRYYLVGGPYPSGNRLNIMDAVKELGCRRDDAAKRWYHTDPAIAEKAQGIIDFFKQKPSEKEIVNFFNQKPYLKENVMENTETAESTNEKHYLTGNTYAAREKLKELGCQYDPAKRQWYNTDPEKAEEAQKHVPPTPERHRIGNAPKTLTDELKEMGCKWNKETGWYHTEKEAAEKAIERVHEAETRHYLKGNGYAVKDELTAIQCRWDGAQKQWYTTDISKVAEAQALIENAPKAVIPAMNVTIKPEASMNIHHIVSFYDNVAETLGLDKDAIHYDCTKIDVSRNIQDNIFKSWEKLGASDFDIGATWCNSGPKTDDKLPPDTIRIEHGFLTNENGEPLPFNNLVKSTTKQRHYIDGENTRAVKDQLKELGCRWDRDKQQWYHTDPVKAKEAQAIVDKAPEHKQEKQHAAERHYIDGENTRAVKDQLKELGCKWDRDKQQWYHTDPAIAEKAQKVVDGASAPTGIGEGRPGRETPATGRGIDGNTVNRVVKEVGRDL